MASQAGQSQKTVRDYGNAVMATGFAGTKSIGWELHRLKKGAIQRKAARKGGGDGNFQRCPSPGD